MRIRSMLFVVLTLFLSALSVAHAQDTAPSSVATYTASVPVSDTSDAQRNHAFAVALGGVLTRTAGQSVTGASGYTDALGSAASLVQNYQYSRASAGASQPFVLHVQFDPAAVNLLAAGLRKQLAAAMPVTGVDASEAARVWVAPLHSALGLARLLATVRADTQVTTVEPIGAAGDGVLLRIRTQASLPALLGSLQSGGHLQPDAMSHPGADASLRWMQ
jgi:uncharacterized protein